MTTYLKNGLKALVLSGLFLGFVSNATAQEVDAQKQFVTEDVTKAMDSSFQRATGWYPSLRIGGTAALNYNKSVVGVVDGTAFTFGVQLKGGLDAVYKNFEWQNSLFIEHQQTKTPNLDSFFKSVDNLDFNTLLLYRIPKAEWLGPFARGRVQTAIFPGYFVTDHDVDIYYYNNKGRDKADANKNLLRKEVLKAQDTAKLTTYVEPLTVTESAGFFVNPYTSDPVTVSMRFGAAGQHLFTRDGFVSIDKDDKDNRHDVKQLKTTHSVGLEGNLELKGKLNNIVLWSLYGNVYYPFAMSDEHELKKVDRIHADIQAKVSVTMSSWASLDYALGVKRQPFVTTDWQVTNTMLLTMGFDIF